MFRGVAVLRLVTNYFDFGRSDPSPSLFIFCLFSKIIVTKYYRKKYLEWFKNNTFGLKPTAVRNEEQMLAVKLLLTNLKTLVKFLMSF